jgi:MurNAc alpha-1-phosphate uridylyltransferase
MKAMIFAAGMGTRLANTTRNIPKALVPVNGIPVIQIAIEKLKFHNFNQIIVNVFHFPDQIRQFLEANHNFGADIAISDESDGLLETGGGLKRASRFFKGERAFLAYNVDIITDLNLQKVFDYHMHSNALATLVVRQRTTKRYLLSDDNNTLCGWKNTSAGEQEMVRKPVGRLKSFGFSGIHVINPSIFDLMNGREVFPIMDTYLNIASDYKILTYNHDNGFWLEIGNNKRLQEAELFFKNKDIITSIRGTVFPKGYL